MVSIMVLLVICWGYSFFTHYVTRGLDSSEGVMDTLKEHAENARTAADDLDAVARDLLQLLRSLNTKCGKRLPQLRSLVHEMGDAEDALTQYTNYVQELPAQLSSIVLFKKLNFWSIIGLDAPLVSTAVAFVCIFTSFVFWVATCGLAACRRFFFCLGSS